MESKTQEFQSALGKKNKKNLSLEIRELLWQQHNSLGEAGTRGVATKEEKVEKRLAINRPSLGKIYVLAKWWWQ